MSLPPRGWRRLAFSSPLRSSSTWQIVHLGTTPTDSSESEPSGEETPTMNSDDDELSSSLSSRRLSVGVIFIDAVVGTALVAPFRIFPGGFSETPSAATCSCGLVRSAGGVGLCGFK